MATKKGDPKKLTTKDIGTRMKSLNEWQLTPKKTQLYRTYKSNSFVASLAFLAKVTVHAEILGHHPDVELSYDKLKIKITTHDVKGLTKKDFELARKIDEITLR